MTGFFGSNGIGTALYFGGNLPYTTTNVECLGYQLGTKITGGMLPEGIVPSAATSATSYAMDVVDQDLPNFDFACYVCPLDEHGNPTYARADVTGETPFYSYLPNGDSNSNGVPVIRWNYAYLQENGLYNAVRIAKYCNVTVIPTTSQNGYFEFGLQEVINVAGTYSLLPASIPYGV